MSISVGLLGQKLSMDGLERAVDWNGVERREGAKPSVLPASSVSEPSANLPQARSIRYNVNRDLRRVVIKIIDANTDKVIEEIPSVDMQKFIERFDAQIGLLLDKKV